MARKSMTAKPKRQGRPATGKDSLVGVRLPPELIERIDTWAKREGAATRSDAIRRLVDQSLAAAHRPHVTGVHKGASRARELAGQELDRLGDQSVMTDEQQRRKRRLVKGPEEFRDLRGDQPKAKR
jgi:Arc/MetJ-type ribon-helix-helix transcriptional regulator